MKRTLLILAILCSATLWGQQDSLKKEKAFKVVPLITSSPLLGWGVGLSTSYLYNTGIGKASKSQLSVGGQYSNTNSYSTFLNNTAWFNDNKWSSATLMTYSSINNEFTTTGEEVKYNLHNFFIAQMFLFKITDKIYLGGPLSFKRLYYDPINDAGADFLEQNGITNESTAGFGFAASYDTRRNKYYPSNASWFTIRTNHNPLWLGAENGYSSLVLDARHYFEGFNPEDVWAVMLYGRYCTPKTPDSGLPSLQGKTLLRGYPAGQYKARFQTGGQTEYRYTIPESRFRVVGFVGLVNLSGGSYGFEGNSRNDDGWYHSEGVGLRYKLQEVTGVDLRLDLVHNSENEISFYLQLNQAF